MIIEEQMKSLEELLADATLDVAARTPVELTKMQRLLCVALANDYDRQLAEGHVPVFPPWDYLTDVAGIKRHQL